MRIVSISLLAALCTVSLSAQSRSVYGPEVPGSDAFVRVVNAVEGSPALVVELGATTFDPLRFAAVSPYRPVTPDIYQLEADGNSVEIIPKSGSYYTVVCGRKAITVLEDQAHTDPARAQLFLYNFSALPTVELKTADGKTAVIPAVAPGASGMRVVNAVSVALAVWSGASRVGAVGDMGLARGSSFSVFVLAGASSVRIVAVKAAVAVK